MSKPCWPFTLNAPLAQQLGLVGYWPAPPSGVASLQDLSGNNNHLPLFGGPAWVAGNGGCEAIKLLKTPPQYAKGLAVIIAAAPCTICCWAKPLSINAGSGSLMALGVDGGIANRFNLIVRSSDGLLNAQATSPTTGTTAAHSASPLTINNWYHCCGVFASTTSRKSYLNGVPGAEDTTLCEVNNPSQVLVGRAASNNTHHCNGIIEDVCVFNRVLTDAEIASLVDPATRWAMRVQA